MEQQQITFVAFLRGSQCTMVCQAWFINLCCGNNTTLYYHLGNTQYRNLINLLLEITYSLVLITHEFDPGFL